jgi:hypothetical protein
MRYLIIAVVLLVGCAEPYKFYELEVTRVADCTEGTGGWGGSEPKCRVTLSNGSRATVSRPVTVGDAVRCRDSKIVDQRCFVL